MVTTDTEGGTRIRPVDLLARTDHRFSRMRAGRMRTLVASLLVALFGAARADAVISFPTMPIAQYREDHRTILLELDTTDATWHATRRYFPSLQLCWEYAEDVADRGLRLPLERLITRRLALVSPGGWVRVSCQLLAAIWPLNWPSTVTGGSPLRLVSTEEKVPLTTLPSYAEKSTRPVASGSSHALMVGCRPSFAS